VKTKETNMEVFDSEISGYDTRAFSSVMKFENIIGLFLFLLQEFFLRPRQLQPMTHQ
jgi:hypothetical protein